MNRTWLITGSSRGLGRTLTETVLKKGHNVVATARRTESLNDLADTYGERVRLVTLDVTDPEAAARAVQAATDAFGRLDVVVNNAGYADMAAIENKVAPLGIKVTVAEPGGMRTNWAGSSMATSPVSEPYRVVVGAAIDAIRGADGEQPGDPDVISRILMDVVEAEEEPPLRLLFGKDAVAVAGQMVDRLAAQDAQWREVSESAST